MINRKAKNFGVNSNIGLDPTSASQSNNNFSNNIYVQTPFPADVKTQPSTFNTRDVDIELDDIDKDTMKQNEVKGLILETYANILLNQDKALIANLISKHTIIIPIDNLRSIIQLMTDGEVEIHCDEDVNCCAARVTYIKKIDAIKIVKDNNVVITDFKQVFNKEYNDLVNKYHMNLKYVLVN